MLLLMRLFTILILSSLCFANLQAQQPPNEVDMTYVLDLEWSHNNLKLASVGIHYPVSYGYIRIFDMLTGEIEYSLNPPSSGFTSVSWSPDDKYLAVAGYDQVIWIIDVESGEHITSMWGHQSTITDLDWNNDGTLLVSSGNWDGLVILWNMQTYERIQNIEAGNLFPETVAFSPDGQRIAVGGEGGVRIHTLNSEVETAPLHLILLTTSAVEWNDDGNEIAIGTRTFPSIIDPASWIGSQLTVFNAHNGNELSTVTTVNETITSISWNLNEDSIIAFYSSDGSTNIWDMSRHELIQSYTGHTLDRGAVDYSLYGGQIAFGTALPTTLNTGSINREGNRVEQLENGLIQIVIPDPSLDRLQTIADACNAPLAIEQSLTADIETNQLSNLITQLESLPTDAIPPACAADLIAVAEAIQNQ